ncbi:nitrilase family protein [Antarcticibacterium flavum]|uniref:Omega-amidase YafV n=1 Tax=Antarcticibacterium flavum TaxID=2058175 RepID=A0A5B7X4X7_9FLAO|nr:MULTISPECIES: nitrilase family protein [Antarcticibacterium]MCM4160560.1 nitrilase family protein [Antarcticibacterium sp. W02-3]QCY69778.1 nitrilase family protein [Antarcticibacterium flavum]
MKENLNVAVLQLDLAWENARKNLEIFSNRINALKEDVDLIVLPEMFTTGFSMNAESLAEEAEGAAFDWMKKIALEKDSAVTGSVIVKEAGNYYNRLYFIFPNGDYKTYDKKHTFTLAKEDQTYTAGKERLIVEYKGWKICPLICYDLRFPVWARNTVNYDLLIYVANWPETRIHAWDTLLQARAIENMAWCIGVNRTGKDGNEYNYNGHTAIYDCLGKSLFDHNRKEEFTEVVSIDRDSLIETRNKLKFLQDRDSFTLN